MERSFGFRLGKSKVVGEDPRGTIQIPDLDNARSPPSFVRRRLFFRWQTTTTTTTTAQQLPEGWTQIISPAKSSPVVVISRRRCNAGSMAAWVLGRTLHRYLHSVILSGGSSRVVRSFHDHVPCLSAMSCCAQTIPSKRLGDRGSWSLSCRSCSSCSHTVLQACSRCRPTTTNDRWPGPPCKA